MNISYETLVSVVSLIVAVIAVIISGFSAIYSARLVELEKAKYKFDKGRYQRELQEEFARQRPLVIIDSAELHEHLVFASKKSKSKTKNQHIFRTGVIHARRGIRYFKFLGVSPRQARIQTKFGDDLEGKTVNLTRKVVYAQVTIANRGDIPLWIKWVAIGIRLRPQLPTFMTSKKYSMIRGYLEWGKLIAGSKHLETLDYPRWFGSDLLLGILLLRKWLPSTPEIKNPIAIILSDATSSQPENFEKPILIEPGSFRKWRLWIELTPHAIEFLQSHHFEPDSVNTLVFWGDENVFEESRIERFFYKFGDFELHQTLAQVKWNNSKGG
jgi:hypothetical protein